MTISRVNPPNWGVGDEVTSTQMNAVDTNATYALDKRAGQSDSLESVVLCENAGRVIPTTADGADADTTYTPADACTVIRVDSTVTASRIYTLSTTSASVGDRIDIFVEPSFAYEITVKRQSGTVLAVLGQSDCTWASFICLSSGWVLWRSSPAELAIEAPGVRLSVDNADTYTRVPISDAVGATAVGLLPYDHERIPLWNGTRWVSRTIPAFASNKITLSALTSGKNYDVFAYWDSTTSAVKLELSAAWATDTTRTDPLAMVPTTALVTKASDPTRLYVGTFRTTSTTTTEDSKTKRFVWSMYNRVERELVVHDGGSTSWTYAGAGVARQARADAANQVEYVVGLGEDIVDAQVSGSAGAGAGGIEAYVGIGIDSTTSNTASLRSYLVTPGATGVFNVSAAYRGRPGFGYHKLVWLEISDGGTATFYGTAAGGNGLSGLIASVRG